MMKQEFRKGSRKKQLAGLTRHTLLLHPDPGVKLPQRMTGSLKCFFYTCLIIGIRIKLIHHYDYHSK